MHLNSRCCGFRKHWFRRHTLANTGIKLLELWHQFINLLGHILRCWWPGTSCWKPHSRFVVTGWGSNSRWLFNRTELSVIIWLGWSCFRTSAGRKVRVWIGIIISTPRLTRRLTGLVAYTWWRWICSLCRTTAWVISSWSTIYCWRGCLLSRTHVRRLLLVACEIGLCSRGSTPSWWWACWCLAAGRGRWRFPGGLRRCGHLLTEFVEGCDCSFDMAFLTNTLTVVITLCT